VTYQNTGVILQVTPKINSDGTVIMRIDPSISSLTTSTVQVGPSIFAPIFDTTRASTTVSCADGQTVVIGGIIEHNDDKLERKVPCLGDMPYVGWMFRFRSDVKTKRELLILLTPQIIRSPCDPINARLYTEEASKIDWTPRVVHELDPRLQLPDPLMLHAQPPHFDPSHGGMPGEPAHPAAEPDEPLHPPRRVDPPAPQDAGPGRSFAPAGAAPLQGPALPLVSTQSR
jgi:hypothetical protein